MTGATTSHDLNLDEIGRTSSTPEVTYYWDTENAVTVEHIDFGDGVYMVRASKTARLEKVDREQQESWDANIRHLADFLAEKFSRFRISVDFVNEAPPTVTGIEDELTEAVWETEDLLQEKERAQDAASTLEAATSIGTGTESFQSLAEGRASAKQSQIERLEAKIDRKLEAITKLKRRNSEWRRNGVSLAYLFTFSTAAEITARPFKDAAKDHVGRIKERFANVVRKTLQGSNFKFSIDEVEHPRLLNRVEYATLIDPHRYGQLIEEHPDLAPVLRDLQAEVVEQYDAYALNDIIVDGQTVERAKATPGQAMNAVIQDLDAEKVATAPDAPNDGPFVGTVAGSQQVVGFDPTDYFTHLYLAGETRAGKSYLKRVLLENAAACGANILSISPTDTQVMGAAFPYGDDGRALASDCYGVDAAAGLPYPDDPADLLEGVNFMSFDSVDSRRTNELLADVLTEVFNAEYPDEEPLIIGIDEAQEIEDAALDQLIKVVKQKAKHNVHVILATQGANEFKRSKKDIRENTETQFLRGEYFRYAENFTHVLKSKREPATLDQGQVILHSMHLDRVVVDVRDPISQVEEPSEDQLDALNQRYSRETVSLPEVSRSSNTKNEKKAKNENSAKTGQNRQIEGADEMGVADVDRGHDVALSDIEADLLDWIHHFLAYNDKGYEYVTESNCHREEGTPCTSRTAPQTLQSLVDYDLLETREIDRNGNVTTGHRPTDMEGQ